MPEATTPRHILLRMIYECRSNHWTTVWCRLSKWLSALSQATDSYFIDSELSEDEVGNDEQIRKLIHDLRRAGLIKLQEVGYGRLPSTKAIEITELGKFMAEVDTLPESVSSLKPDF